MYSVNHPPSPDHGSFLLCPLIRMGMGEVDYCSDDGKRYVTIKSSYFSSGGPRSDHHILRPLYGCNNKEGEPTGFTCNACYLTKVGTTYYFCNCVGWESTYHKECVEAPTGIIVPGYHPKHPLQLSRGTRSDRRMVSHCCGNLNKGYFYYCSICDFSIHPVCATTILLSIDHPKWHEHTLMYFHRKASLTCNICGFNDEWYFIYICLQCDFIVHKMCIYLPRVIMVSRHDHRLSIISAFPHGNWLCGVCHKQVKRTYSGYICMKGCEFAVHSSCATQADVWDGRELEGEPDEDEDIMSFSKLSDGTIQYFSHPHHPLRLFEKIDGVYDENTYCQACILPLHDENVYKCEKCDFNLHQTCANLPRRKQHLLHVHQLILQEDSENFYTCNACDRFRLLTSLKYVCSKGCDFSIDIRCSMVSEPFKHPCHHHPLFLSNTRPRRSCWICSSSSSTQSLDCIICNFSLCFSCTTLPYKVRYKHDNHFLRLSHVTSQVEHYWCEVCEEEMTSGWIYACSSCNITLHIKCANGHLYEKPGGSFQTDDLKVDFLSNNSLTRPICFCCRRRSKYKLLFKRFVDESCVILCSMSCLHDTMI